MCVKFKTMNQQRQIIPPCCEGPKPKHSWLIPEPLQTLKFVHNQNKWKLLAQFFVTHSSTSLSHFGSKEMRPNHRQNFFVCCADLSKHNWGKFLAKFLLQEEWMSIFETRKAASLSWPQLECLVNWCGGHSSADSAVWKGGGRLSLSPGCYYRLCRCFLQNKKPVTCWKLPQKTLSKQNLDRFLLCGIDAKFCILDDNFKSIFATIFFQWKGSHEAACFFCSLDGPPDVQLFTSQTLNFFSEADHENCNLSPAKKFPS